ncbi:MAG: hypothetical protein WB796_06085, partial [Candidatus Sulfotelmatobacter sp.]
QIRRMSRIDKRGKRQGKNKCLPVSLVSGPHSWLLLRAIKGTLERSSKSGEFVVDEAVKS